MPKQTDPVCEMEIEVGEAIGLSDYQEQIYYFCSTDCKTKFDENPEKYINQTEKS